MAIGWNRPDTPSYDELHVYPGAIHAFEMVPDTTLAGQAAMDLRRGLGRLLG